MVSVNFQAPALTGPALSMAASLTRPGRQGRVRDPRFHAGFFSVVLIVSASTSGCFTTLGYVPENIKLRQISNTATYIPAYREVKQWAYDVADGYGSRATMNRQAVYAGALFGAAATGAIAGLAAFDSGSLGLIGIPIGATFLAGVAYIYSSEEKAQIYALGSRYVKDLVTLSDKRLANRRIAVQRTRAALEEARKDLEDADEQLREAERQEESQKEIASAAHRDADQEAKGPRKIGLSSLAEAADKLTLEAKGAVAKAQLVRNVAQDRVDEAVRRDEAWKALLSAKLELAQARGDAATTEAQLKVHAAEGVWKEITDAEAAEALCLRMDINNVMRKVEDHKAMLDPKNVVAQLKAVEEAAKKAKATSPKEGTAKKTGPSEKGKADTAEPKLPPADLSDLRPPVKSICENAI
jgi:hypothetical protein